MAEQPNYNVTVAKPKSVTGGITFAPLGTDVPEDAKSVLDVAFKAFGYVSEDGVKLSEDASDEDVKVWGGVKVRKVRSEYGATITFTALSTRNPATLRAVFGNRNVEVTKQTILVKHGADTAPVQVFTIETVDENGFARRYVIPKGQLTVSGERNLTHAGADGFEVTIECTADNDGYCYYEYTQMPNDEALTDD